MSLAMRLIAVALFATSMGCQQTKTESTAATSTQTEASPPPATTPTDQSTPATSGGQEVRMPNGLVYVDLKVGDGALAESGMRATVHYTGWLTDQTKFDSSVDRGQPFSFKLGAGEVIRGWDEGVKGMRVGGKRKLTIPPDMAYGANGQGPIPANATLVFEVELLDVK